MNQMHLVSNPQEEKEDLAVSKIRLSKKPVKANILKMGPELHDDNETLAHR